MKLSPSYWYSLSFGLAFACSSTPSPTTSSSAAGSSSSLAGAAATGGNSSAGGNASTAGAAGSTSQAGSSGGASGNVGAGTGGVTVAGGGGASGGGGAGLPPIEECTGTPSVDRFTQWTASGEGTTVPATGSILVKDGEEYVGKVQFVGSEWHVLPVLLANKFGTAVDLSSSKGFTLTYSATSALHVQLRTKSHWSGGAQYATDIPSTGGKVETRTFSFEPAGWMSLFDPPALTFADTLKEGMGLVFVGDSENTIVFSGLRVDGHTPPCQ